jgi:ribonuclease VapC
MVIDASALLAILLGEPEAARFVEMMERSESRRMSAETYLEAAVVVDSRGDAVARREFDHFLRRAGISIEPFTLEQAQVARQAYLDFGKGRHPAGLNFGDCIAYALAKACDEPLLYKGKDFNRTDVKAAQ